MRYVSGIILNYLALAFIVGTIGLLISDWTIGIWPALLIAFLVIRARRKDRLSE